MIQVMIDFAAEETLTNPMHHLPSLLQKFHFGKGIIFSRKDEEMFKEHPKLAFPDQLDKKKKHGNENTV